jgi:hypothetical protein
MLALYAFSQRLPYAYTALVFLQKNGKQTGLDEVCCTHAAGKKKKTCLLLSANKRAMFLTYQ